MQAQAARKGGSPVVAWVPPYGTETMSPSRSRGFGAELPTPPEISPKDFNHQSYTKSPEKKSRQLQRAVETENLMATLMKLADPSFCHQLGDSPNGASAYKFTNMDEGLVLALLQSVGVACSNILTSDRQGERYESRIWRRRLDVARKVLSGQLEIDKG